jgi:hypothetical protein
VVQRISLALNDFEFDTALPLLPEQSAISGRPSILARENDATAQKNARTVGIPAMAHGFLVLLFSSGNVRS